MIAPLNLDVLTQQKYEVRFDWGSEGLASVAPGAGVIVLVDALTFTTTVELAVTHGLEVLPFDGSTAESDSDAALEFAERENAVLAAPRDGEGPTISASSITADSVASIAPASRLVVRSSNGSRLASRAAEFGVPVIAASLRNRTAVARWVLDHQTQLGERARVAVVAAGESRSDGSTRFAVEDLLAAGALVDALAEVGIDYSSPEAAAAGAAYTGLRRAVAHLYTASVSGQQLIDADYRRDAELAGEVDASTTVPVLRDGAFVAG